MIDEITPAPEESTIKKEYSQWAVDSPGGKRPKVDMEATVINTMMPGEGALAFGAP